LLEREQELARVSELVDAAAAGEFRLAVVEGPAGAGKSAILGALAGCAAERGVRVLRATGLELEREYPFGVVRQLFEPALYEVDDAVRDEVFAGAAGPAERLLSGRESGSGAPSADQGFALLHSFYWALVGLSDLGPLALVVDDLQWADSLSLRFLAFALKRSDGLPVLVACACRDLPAAERPEALGAVLSGSGVVIRPGPLSGAAIGALLTGAVGREFDAELVAEAERLTDGNPLYVCELADWLSREEAGDPVQMIRSAAPAAVGRRVQATLARLDPAAQALAGAAAILGDEVPLARAALLADTVLAQASTCADVLARAGILKVGEPLRFRHPLVLEAVLESIEPRTRAHEHGRAAKLLIAASEPPERVAVHLLESDPAGDPEVVNALCVAAEHAGAEGAPGLAIRALRRALREPPQPTELPLVLIRLGRLETLVGDPAAREHFEQALASGGSARELGWGVLSYVWLLIRQGRLEEADSLIDRVLAETTDREQRLMLEAELGVICEGALIPSARARLERATVGLTGQTPAERLLLGARACDAFAAGAMSVSEAAPLVKQALADPPPFIWSRNAPTFSHLTSALLQFDELEAADTALTDAIADARRRGISLATDTLWTYRAIIAWRRGQLLRAEADVRTAVDVAVQVGSLDGAPTPVIIAVDVLLDRGELAEAERLLDEHNLLGSPRRPGPGSWAAELFGARGRLRLAQGQTEHGIADLTEALARRDALGHPRPDLRGKWGSSLVPALMHAGRADEAREIADTALAAARGLGVPRYVARCLHACALAGADGPDIDQLREAVSIYERIDAPLELAHALASLGTALRRRRRPADSRDPLRRALDLAHACGARPLAERAEHQLRAAGARPRRDRITGRDALTASEQRIAELAIEGMTNRQIAESLFITRKTVESHLDHVFRKLGIHTRGELQRGLAAEDELSPVG
jgi:DNA-binding CsgD family transcriptional regulator